MNIVFFGTPAFSVPTLEHLLAHPDITVRAVVCQPDRPSGRGQTLQAPPVKQVATAHNIPVFQPVSIRKDEALHATLKALLPDFFVTIAFGQILSQAVLNIPSMGTVNVHASLLPALRGANPIQWAILNGHTETGLTTMLTDIGVDTGAMLLKTSTPIDPAENAERLADRLSQLGGPLLVDTLQALRTGTLLATPQDDGLATHAPKLNKADATIDWRQPADSILLKIRGQAPWPGTSTLCREQPLKLLSASVAQDDLSLEPGEFKVVDKTRLLIGTLSQPIQLLIIQPAGKKAMLASDWLRGLPKDTF